MNHAKAFGIKLIVHLIVVLSIFGVFYNASINNLFWISLIITTVAYIIGDLWILSRFGNVAATLADFPLAFFSLWLLASLWIDAPLPIVLASLFAAFFITVSEPFIHMYIQNRTKENDRSTFSSHQLQTEFAEEDDIYRFKKRKNKRK